MISIFLMTSIIFAGSRSVEALDIPGLGKSSSKVENDIPIEILVEPSEDMQSETSSTLEEPLDEIKVNNYPDLGDDQVFPFVAGLDSYESMKRD